MTESRELWIPVNLPEKGLDGNFTGLSVFGWHHLACKCICKQQLESGLLADIHWLGQLIKAAFATFTYLRMGQIAIDFTSQVKTASAINLA
jgi:hypothetical protein